MKVSEMNPEQLDKFKDVTKKFLREEDEVLVTFKKKDGTDRLMKCSLKSGVVPPATKADPASQTKVRTVSDEVCVVYDVEKEGWRSFRWDSVQLVEVEGASVE